MEDYSNNKLSFWNYFTQGAFSSVAHTKRIKVIQKLKWPRICIKFPYTYLIVPIVTLTSILAGTDIGALGLKSSCSVISSRVSTLQKSQIILQRRKHKRLSGLKVGHFSHVPFFLGRFDQGQSTMDILATGQNIYIDGLLLHMTCTMWMVLN